MPVTAGGDPSFPAPRPRKPKKATAPRKSRAAHSAKASGPGTFHETSGAGGGPQSSTALGSAGGSAPRPAGGALAALDLADLGGGAVAGTGLGEVLLDLVGEGQLRLGSALAAWQREQERVSNRAWRRPGGMARMGGL
jgi:hypothetical protein